MTTLAGIELLLERLREHGCKIEHSGGSLMAQCPAHDDDRCSLSLGVGEDDKPLFHCFAGCEKLAILTALHVTWREFLGDRDNATNGTAVAERVYEIRAIDGKLVAHHHRQDSTSGKKMWWSRPGVAKGLGGLKVTALPLYGTELLADETRKDETVVITEGERAADALRRFGALSLATTTGANKTPSKNVLSVLAGRDVLLWPDNDDPGRLHMIELAVKLRGTANDVRILDWPDAPPRGDAADFRGTADDLHAMIEKARDVEQVEAQQAAEDAKKNDDVLTDVTNAREFVARQGTEFRHTKALGWLRWDSTRWASCTHGEELQAAIAAIEAVYAEVAAEIKRIANDLRKPVDKVDKVAIFQAQAALKKLEKIRDHCVNSQKLPRLQAMLAIAATDPAIAIDAADLDRDPWLLNTRSGTVDLRTGELREHRREDLLSLITGASYDLQAPCNLWLTTLREVFEGEDRDEVIDYFQRLAGYAATGSTREEIFAVLWGDGRNGKGVTVETMTAALGDYAKAAPMSLFLEARGDGAKRFAVAEFRGVRMLVASEATEGKAFDVAQLKTWTGGDTRYAERKNRDPFHYTPSDTPFLLLNDKPRVRSWDVAFEERLHLLPFEHSFTGSRADKSRKAKLRDELDGVLAWIVAGAVTWCREGLRPPPRVRAAIDSYRSESVHADEFVREQVVRVIGMNTLQSDAYAAFVTWSRQRGHQTVSDRKFGAYLENAGFTREKGARGQVIQNAALRPRTPNPDDDDDDDDGPTYRQKRKNGSP